MKNIFYDSWESFGRAVIITILAYLTLVFMLRISGKRTLSKMNAFDFIVTIALGSSLSAVALNKSIALIDGIVVFLLLILMQFIITWLSVRIPKVKSIITSRPTLLLYKGEIFNDVLKKERITTDELYIAARKHGIANLKDIGAIILESTGDISIISQIDTKNSVTLKDVENYPDKQMR